MPERKNSKNSTSNKSTTSRRKKSTSYIMDIVEKHSMMKSASKKTPDQIYKKLYLGNKKHSQDKSYLKKKGITSIIEISHKKQEIKFPKDFTYYQFIFNDKENVNLEDHLYPILKVLEEETKKGIVFIHCLKGVSRSASVVIAFLILKKGLTFEVAFDYVRSKRFCINPNSSFLNTLKSFKI